jgi:hypothetical protein
MPMKTDSSDASIIVGVSLTLIFRRLREVSFGYVEDPVTENIILTGWLVLHVVQFSSKIMFSA